MNLSQAVQKAGVVVGDIIEIVSCTDWLSKKIGKVIGDEPTTSEGLLIEITAIGQVCILGCLLSGMSANGGDKYKDIVWERTDQERSYRDGATVRKIGYRARPLDPTSEIVFTLPDLKNVYTRCQNHDIEL